jgi:hypothetical protein
LTLTVLPGETKTYLKFHGEGDLTGWLSYVSENGGYAPWPGTAESDKITIKTSEYKCDPNFKEADEDKSKATVAFNMSRAVPTLVFTFVSAFARILLTFPLTERRAGHVEGAQSGAGGLHRVEALGDGRRRRCGVVSAPPSRPL